VNLDRYRFLVFTDDPRAEETIRAALPAAAPLRIVSMSNSVGLGARHIDETSPDVVIVSSGHHPDQALRLMSEITEQSSDAAVIALHEGHANGFMANAFRAGADDLIVLPIAPDQLAFELQKVMARRRAPGIGAPRSPIITVLGPKGGTGKTMTSCNLAVALADSGARPIVVDIDLQFGDVGLALGLKPEHTIYDLVTAGGTLDGDKVEGFAVKHRSGAAAMLAPTRPDQASVVTTPFLAQLLDVLRLRFDFVIIDTPPAFSPEVITAIDASSHLCLVGMLDALSLKDTKIGLETLQQMGHEPDEITLVLNRADSNVGISTSDVSTLIKKSPDILIPSDRAIPRALTNGQTIYESDPKSGAGRAFAQLAATYLAASSPDEGANLDADQLRGPRRLLTRRGR
jgi:pilus assembly protein CpaE